MDFKEKYGPWALVTGASSGIGKEFAVLLAERGLNLIITARRKNRLDEIKKHLESRYSVTVKTAVCDLAREDFMKKIQQASKGLEVGLLVNNAGYGITGPFSSADLHHEKDMISVNCTAPTALANEFTSDMIQRKKGGMIFVSSVLAFSPTPYMASYAASKSYNLYLAEALSYELSASGIDVLALCPGTTATEFADNAKMKAVLAMDAESVAEKALQSLGKKTVFIPGTGNRLMIAAGRFLPRKILTMIYGRAMTSLGRHLPPER